MKVKELILRLQACDPELIVVVDGYEGGVTEVQNIVDRKPLKLNVNEDWWYGEHEIDSADHDCFAVYISRG